MKKYLVEITETLQKQIEIEATSKEEAIRIAREKYRNEEVILYPDDHVETTFNVLKPIRNHDEFER